MNKTKSKLSHLILLICVASFLLILLSRLFYHGNEKDNNSLIKIKSLRRSNGLNEVKNPQDQDKYNIHIVFSTDCSFFQDWQTLLVFHSAVKVNQIGKITRIASGCDTTKQKELINLYNYLFPQYSVHFTPDYKTDKKTGQSYDFYNKPYGLEHWLESSNSTSNDEEIIVLLDPDMIFLRPIDISLKYNKFNDYIDPSDFYNSSVLPIRVSKGYPSSQLYGLGAPWTSDNSHEFNRTNVCGADSPCLTVNRKFGSLHYSVGPPYIVEKNDLIKITKSWTKFVPKVYEKYPELLAEMFAYSMAAAHENLPHITIHNYMVSNVDMDSEGWKTIDKLEDNVCEPYNEQLFYPNINLPTVLHYCQFFRIGKYGFQKRRIQKNIFSCESPLLAELPTDLGKLTYKNRDGEIVQFNRKQARRNTFMLNIIYNSINSLLIYYKSKMCDKSKNFINYNKTINVVELKY